MSQIMSLTMIDLMPNVPRANRRWRKPSRYRGSRRESAVALFR